MNAKCPKYERCPIYTGILKDKNITANAYRRFFCDSDDHVNCKRYMVSQSVGVCPPDLLPNSPLSVDEIITKYKLG